MITTDKRVLITGAAGNVGQKLRRHLERQPGYELVLIDLKSAPDSGIVGTNLAVRDPSWEQLFDDIDCVVHLAAEANSAAPWRSILPNNVVATINVFDAAIAHGVARVVFGSSLQAMDGYEGTLSRVTPEMETRPVNAYGISKVFGEEVARAHAARGELSVICLRFGSILRGDARPRIGMDPLRPQLRWLSTADLCQACERAITVEGVDFAILNVISRNEGSPWDLSATERVLGYHPQDGLTTRRPHLWRRVVGRIRRMGKAGQRSVGLH